MANFIGMPSRIGIGRVAALTKDRHCHQAASVARSVVADGPNEPPATIKPIILRDARRRSAGGKPAIDLRHSSGAKSVSQSKIARCCTMTLPFLDALFGSWVVLTSSCSAAAIKYVVYKVMLHCKKCLFLIAFFLNGRYSGNGN